MKKNFIFLFFFIIVIYINPIYALDVEDIEIHGFISQGYLLTDENNYLAETKDGTFEFNEMGINFSSDLSDSLRVGLQLFSRDLGSIGNNEVVFDWAFGDYRWQNWLGVRAGRIKIDYGLYNETRDMDMLRTSVMLPQSVYPELWRDSFARINGVSLYGYLPLSIMGSASYNFQIGEMDFKANEGFVRFQGPRMHESLELTDMDADYAWFSSLRWDTPLSGLKAKSSYYEIKELVANGSISYTLPDGTAADTEVSYEFAEKYGYIFSLEYTWNNLILSGEYSQDNYQIKYDLQNEVSQTPDQESPQTDAEDGVSETPVQQADSPPQPTNPKLTSEGWYLSAAYRFTDWLELGARYSEYYPNKDNKDGDQKNNNFTSWLKTTTLSTRFDINENWILKLEASYNDGFGGVNLAENTPDEFERYWLLFAAKVTFSF